MREDLKLRVLHLLLLNVTSSYGRAIKTLRAWCVRPQTVLERKALEVAPLTRLA